LKAIIAASSCFVAADRLLVSWHSFIHWMQRSFPVREVLLVKTPAPLFRMTISLANGWQVKSKGRTFDWFLGIDHWQIDLEGTKLVFFRDPAGNQIEGHQIGDGQRPKSNRRPF
jgi:hypothetical protein